MGMVKNSQSCQKSKFGMSLQYVTKVDLEVDFNTLSIKVFYKVILSLLMGMVKYSQSTQSKEFAISLQYIKREIRDGVHFVYTYKRRSFYKMALSFLMEVTRYVQSSK